MITKDELLKIASYLKIVHQSKGRVRLRVSPKILEHKDELDPSLIDEFPKIFDGIKSIKFNKLIGSITVLYDENLLPSTTWENLINGKIDDQLWEKFKELIKEK